MNSIENIFFFQYIVFIPSNILSRTSEHYFHTLFWTEMIKLKFEILQQRNIAREKKIYLMEWNLMQLHMIIFSVKLTNLPYLHFKSNYTLLTKLI